MNIFSRLQYKKRENYKRMQKEAPIFVAAIATAIILEVILLVVFGGWWIILFGIVTAFQGLFMQVSFYILNSNISILAKNVTKAAALYGVIFPLVYVPPILDSTEYSYILFGLRPEPGSSISNIISTTSPYAWILLGIVAVLLVVGVIYTFIKNHYPPTKTKV